jgi:hypothetical protein
MKAEASALGLAKLCFIQWRNLVPLFAVWVRQNTIRNSWMARKNCRNKSWVHRGYNSSSPGREEKSKNIGVREARTLDLRITHFSYETYALANCATTPFGVSIES